MYIERTCKNTNLELITVRTFETSTEAHLLKVKLSSAGFETFLVDEKTIDTDPLIASAIGYIKLKVKKADYNAVLDVLDEIPEMVTVNPKGHVVICTHCQSKQVASAVYEDEGVEGIVKGIWRSVKMLNPKYTDNTYMCLKCNEKFVF